MELITGTLNYASKSYYRMQKGIKLPDETEFLSGSMVILRTVLFLSCMPAISIGQRSRCLSNDCSPFFTHFLTLSSTLGIFRLIFFTILMLPHFNLYCIDYLMRLSMFSY